MRRGWKIARRVAMGLSLVLVVGFGWVRYEIWTTEGCACGLMERTPFAVYNPFRARGPERVAAQYLDAVQHGRCLQLPASVFVAPDQKAALCGLRYPLNGWDLRSRESDADGVSLGYGVGWNVDPERMDGLGILTKKVDGVWKIDSVQAEGY